MTLALDLARALSPVVMAEDIGMAPDPWQAEELESEHQRTLVNCHRQSGKSTVASIKAVRKAVYKIRSLVLLFSPSMRQSGEVFQKCLTVYRAIGKPVIAEAENALSLILENGSRIVSLPGSEATVRGYSGVDLIIIDEAAAVKDGLIAAIRPMLAVSGGSLMALSTPRGKQGWWWQAWAAGGSAWRRILVPACQIDSRGRLRSLSPRITTAFLEEERNALGERLFMQEYMCSFVETTDQAFGEEAIASAFSRTVKPIEFDDSLDLEGPVS